MKNGVSTSKCYLGVLWVVSESGLLVVVPVPPPLSWNNPCHSTTISISHYLTTISRSHQYLTNISPISHQYLRHPYPTVLSLAAPQLNSLSPISACSLALQPLRGIKSLPRTFIRIRIKWACNQGKSTGERRKIYPKKARKRTQKKTKESAKKRRRKELKKEARERTEKMFPEIAPSANSNVIKCSLQNLNFFNDWIFGTNFQSEGNRAWSGFNPCPVSITSSAAINLMHWYCSIVVLIL